MSFKDLREFLDHLDKHGQLKRITHPIDPHYEMTEISDRTLRAGGPALLFEHPIGSDIPVLTQSVWYARACRHGDGAEIRFRNCVRSANYWLT